MSEREYLGRMYVGLKPCGKVSAMSWCDKGHEKEVAKSVASWIKRGDKVECLERYEGDPMPEMSCYGKKTPCACRDAAMSDKGGGS